MTKLLTVIILILTISMMSCVQTKTQTVNKEQQQYTKADDTSLIAVFPFDTTLFWVFKESKPTELTNVDLIKIETILNKCINAYNPEQERQFLEISKKHPRYKLNKKNFCIDLTRYKRQYVAVLNSKGEKEVWVNCFCDPWDSDWRKYLIIVKDGGNCFFNLKINLTTGNYYNLIVNGDS